MLILSMSSDAPTVHEGRRGTRRGIFDTNGRGQLSGKKTMNFSFDQTEYVGVLTFGGSLTEPHAAELMEIMMVSWEKTPSLIVDLGEVTELDGTCLQIFCKAYRLALMTDKLFAIAALSREAWEQISGNPPACYAECHAGFPAFEFPFSCVRNCLWGIKGRAVK